MVCSREDSNNQISMNSGVNERTGTSRQIEILTPDGKTVKLSLQENAEIQKVKNDCELLCGIPSDLQNIQLQGKDLCNDATLSSLRISDGCTLRLTVPQWWQKFISTCYKGDTKQVRKRIYVKMSEISREERSFTAAFIAAVQGNHNLMFAAFASRKINLLSKTRLTGRNLLHAAVSGGSTSCVANILMNGGNALLEAPDEKGETPVSMAERLYGQAGDMLKFLNIYLELHRRERSHFGDSRRYWDNLERNNNNSDVISANYESKNDDGCVSRSDENVIKNLGELTLAQDEPTRTNFTATEFFANESDQNVPSVSKINIEDYDARTCNDALVVPSSASPGADEGKLTHENLMNVSGSEQGYAHTSDTGYYSSGSHSVGKDGTETFWNDDLFTQKNTPSSEWEMTKEEFNSREQTAIDEADSIANDLSTPPADQTVDRDSESSLAPCRGAQLRFLEQKRKRSTTERPNLEQITTVRTDTEDNEACRKGQTEEHNMNEAKDKVQITEVRDKETSAITYGEVINESKGQAQGPMIISSNRDSSDNCPSPKPLRRAQLRKKSIVEQRRRRSIAQRPNIEGLETAQRKLEDCENLERPNIDELETGQRKVQDCENLEQNAENTSGGIPEEKAQGEKTESRTKNLGDTTRVALNAQNHQGNISDNAERKNIEVQLEQHTEGYKRSDSLRDESPVSARHVLRFWQEQAHEAEVAALSADECDDGRSPKLVRRAFIRKQAYMEQRRKKSATERPDILKLISRKVDGQIEDASQDAEVAASREGCGDFEPFVAKTNSPRILNADNLDADPSNAIVTTGSDIPEKQNETFRNATAEQVNAGLFNAFFTAGSDTSEQHNDKFELLSRGKEKKERIPIRKAQRCSNTGPLLGTRAEDTRPSGWSSMSGEESDESDQERVVVAETFTPITGSLARAPRRRRLPILPDKGIKLPVIKIEDSGMSRGLTAITTLHPPLARSRSGSTCSEDSVSSTELSSERTRNYSEGDIPSTPAILKKTDNTKSIPMKQRRQSVPNSPFNFTQHQPIIRSRKNSVQVEEIEEQGFGISPQLRARIKLRDQPREKLPWNEWKTRIRSGSLPGQSDENSAAQFMMHRESQSKAGRHVAWNEKKARPNTARHRSSRTTFTEWLDNKTSLKRTRPTSARLRGEEEHKDDMDNDVNLPSSKSYEDWLLKKDLEALEREEKMHRKMKNKFHRTQNQVTGDS